MIVADASLLANFLIPGPDSEAAEAAYRKDPAWCVPALWRSELRNVVLKHVRGNGMKFEHANAVMDNAELIVGGRETLVETPAVLKAAVAFEVTAYDAEYLALARHLDIPLLTFDKKLRIAASGVAIDPRIFVAPPGM